MPTSWKEEEIEVYLNLCSCWSSLLEQDVHGYSEKSFASSNVSSTNFAAECSAEVNHMKRATERIELLKEAQGPLRDLMNASRLLRLSHVNFSNIVETIHGLRKTESAANRLSNILAYELSNFERFSALLKMDVQSHDINLQRTEHFINVCTKGRIPESLDSELAISTDRLFKFRALINQQHDELNSNGVYQLAPNEIRPQYMDEFPDIGPMPHSSLLILSETIAEEEREQNLLEFELQEQYGYPDFPADRESAYAELEQLRAECHILEEHFAQAFNP